MTTYFLQGCPTCGRRLQIRVEHLGKRVRCQHCRGWLTASDSTTARSDPAEADSSLLRRADELLESAARRTEELRNRQFPPLGQC
jgi:DNA-directed RNA polymerase subunit RPC12/RpoP